VALAGLVPSIRSHGPELLPAVATAGICATVVILARRAPRRQGELAVVPVVGSPASARHLTPRRAGVAVVAGAAALVALVALRRRITGGTSVVDRLRIWRQTLSGIASGSVFGQGPRQLADLSRGHLGPLLTHDDPMQYAKYYGVLGVAALVFATWRLVAAARDGRGWGAPDLWATAVAVSAAVAAVALVDFPLQVPIVPALLSLVVGATLQPGLERKDGHATKPI